MPHIHEKIDFVADVFVVHEGKVLLRKHDKYNIWLGAGGHIELDEDPNQAAIRETKEEVGLDIELWKNPNTPAWSSAPNTADFKSSKELIPPQFLNQHKIGNDGKHKHISFIYFATTKDNHIQPGKNEAEVEIRWFTKTELDDPKFGVSERIKFYAHAALDALS